MNIDMDRILVAIIVMLIVLSAFAITTQDSLAQLRWCPRC